MNETRRLAEFVATTQFADLPVNVVQHAKHLVLDHFGVALYAARSPWGRIAQKYARKFSAAGGCTVYGETWKTSAQHAAFANGLCAHGYELDDSFEGGVLPSGSASHSSGARGRGGKPAQRQGFFARRHPGLRDHDAR